MKILFKKMLRELFNNRTQTIMTLLAFTAGIVIFGTVLVSHNIITRDIDLLHQVTKSPSIVISADEITDELLSVIKSSEHISAYESFAHVSLSARGANKLSYGMDLFAYENPADVKVEKYTLEDGRFCNTGEIMLERLCFNIGDVKIGDTMIISGKNGNEFKLDLVGSVHDIREHPAIYERRLYGFVSLETLNQIGYKPDTILLLASGDPYNQENVEFRKNRIVEELKAAGINVNAHIPSFLGASEHAHEYLPLAAILQIIGIVVYILAALLIVSLLSSILSKQTKQIGIIKSIGGGKFNLFVVYISMILSISVFCLVVGGPLSIITGRLLTVFLLAITNYDMINPSISPITLILILSASFCVPLIFSFFPIIRSCNVTVKEALNSYGISSNKDSIKNTKNIFLRLSGFLPLYLRKAVKNLIIYRKRVVASVILMTIGGTAFICANITLNSLELTVDKAMENYNYDYEFMLANNDNNDLVNSILTKDSGIGIYEEWKVLDTYFVNRNKEKNDEIKFQIPPSNSKLFTPMIAEGRWFNEGDTNKVVLNRHNINGDRYNVGDSMEIMVNETKQTFEVIGFVREVGFQNQYLLADQKSYSQATSIYKIKFDTLSESRVALGIVNLEDALRNNKLSFQNSVKVKDYIQSFKTNSINVLNFFLNAALFMLIVSGIGLASIMCIQIMGRIKEIGIIQSLGGSQSQIYKMIVMETGAIGVMSFILTVCLSIPLSFLLNNVLGVILFRVELFTMMTGSYFLTLAFYIAIIIGLASLAPAQIAVKTSVKEALAYE